MIEFPVMRSHQNPDRAKRELNNAIRDLAKRGFEVSQPMQCLNRYATDQYYNKENGNAQRVSGNEFQTYFVKMRSVES